jgi:hypothetical protein
MGLFAIIILGLLIYNQYLLWQFKYPDSMISYGTNYSYEATGVYIPNCGYFVDTRGRNIEAINNTEYHEACHALIQQDDRGHYCHE